MRHHTTKTIEELNELIDSLNLDYTRLTDRFQEITQTVRLMEQKTDRLSFGTSLLLDPSIFPESQSFKSSTLSLYAVYVNPNIISGILNFLRNEGSIY